VGLDWEEIALLESPTANNNKETDGYITSKPVGNKAVNSRSKDCLIAPGTLLKWGTDKDRYPCASAVIAE
jgi:hypothetical protein